MKLRLLLLVGPLLWVAQARAACPTVDLEMPVERVAESTARESDMVRLAAYRHDVIASRPAAYQPGVLRPFDEASLGRAILASLAEVRGSDARARSLRTVRDDLPIAEAAFRRALPDFRCDFPIYLMDSLGSFDGAGRRIDGVPALAFGIDQIAAEGDALRKRPFLAHELFHRYHDRSAHFSDDPGDRQAIWRTLWAEGLATYASYRLTPGATVDDALLAPRDLAAKAAPHLAEIAAGLLAHLDAPDSAAYRVYFTYGDPAVAKAGLPWRSGYYAGFLVARELGRKHSLQALAHMSGPALRQCIRRILEEMAMTGEEAA